MQERPKRRYSQSTYDFLMVLLCSQASYWLLASPPCPVRLQRRAVPRRVHAAHDRAWRYRSEAQSPGGAQRARFHRNRATASVMAQAGQGELPYTIDLRFLDQPGAIASYLLRSDEDAALVDVGPGSSVTTLLASLDYMRVAPEQIRHLLLTHIHLDHAGATGALLGRLPDARVYVHEAGAPHLIDPSRLVGSASRVYGSLMKRLWGDMLPVPAERIVVLHDGQVLELAGRRLQVLYAPGHAIHHVVYRDLDDGSMYVGDVAGVRMPGCAYVRPPTPPPDLDLDAWEATIDRIAALHPTAFYITHFGRATGTEEHLDQLRRRLRAWEQLVLEQMRAGQDHAAITLALQRASDLELSRLTTPEHAHLYETAGSSAMNVSGFERYLHRRHPELATLPTSL